MRPMRSSVIVALLGCAAASSALAQAPTNMNLIISQQDGPSWNYQSNPTVGTWTHDTSNQNLWHHAGAITNPSFGVDWNLDLDPDPFLSNSFNLTNTTAAVQTYTVTVVLPIIPLIAPTATFGSVSGSVGDTNSSGFAQMNTIGPGSAIYNAYIDGGLYQQLLPDAYSVTTFPFPGATQPFPSGVNFFNFPGGQPGALTSIAITNTFTLTPGDTVTMISTFRIEPAVPAPAGAALLGLGGIVAARRRRN